MPPPIIDRIRSLKDFGVFKTCSSADLHPFARYNLIYGFNGSGKTTLSRLLSSLETGQLHPELPATGHFEIELSDGSSLSTPHHFSNIKGRLVVFNGHFVDQNLRWNEGRANPVFFIGKLQADAADRLVQLEVDLAKARAISEQVQGLSESSENAFGTFKRDTARSIADQLDLGRRYDASNLASDMEAGVPLTFEPLSEEGRKSRRSLIRQEAPPAKLNQVTLSERNFEAFFVKIDALLKATLGQIAAVDLSRHQSMIPWVKQGMDFHLQHDESQCLFCGGTLTQQRIKQLQSIINSSYDQLSRELELTRSELFRLEEKRTSIKGTLPSPNDITAVHREQFAGLLSELRLLFDEATAFSKVAASLLDSKTLAVNERLETEKKLNLARAKWLDEKIRGCTYEINQLIANHNDAVDQFEQAKQSARRELKADLLKECSDRYWQAKSEQELRKQEVARAESRANEIVAEIDKIKAELRKHGPAADIMNRLIEGYLGHAELEIIALDEGYEIRRMGYPIGGPLSDGEKTAIGFCYFLSTLEAEGRRVSEMIAVIDDPISSLDTKALNYAGSLIKGALSEAGQLIILTHNLHFMNEIKKWLKPKLEKETASLMFLECVKADPAAPRSSRIVKLPRLLREYDSEYHYLFSLVLRFSVRREGYDEFFYLMPNAMRKVLDIFLAFKLPGSDGLASKVNALAKQFPSLANEVRALDRLVQMESHADSLDDLTSFSSMAIEETHQAARGLCNLMQTIDSEHFQRLRRVCGD